MEPNQQMGGQNMGGINTTMPHDKKGGAGALVGSVIIIVIIILGGLYFFKNSKSINQNTNDASITQEQLQLESSTNMYTQSQSNQGTSDEIKDIEADLNATDIDSLDQGL